MQLEELPSEIKSIILDYKAEFDRLLRFQHFFDTIMRHLLFWHLFRFLDTVLRTYPLFNIRMVYITKNKYKIRIYY